MRSDGHLSTKNMEGVGSVPPLLSQGLHQDNTGRPLGHQMDNGLETRSMDIAMSLLIQNGVP